MTADAEPGAARSAAQLAEVLGDQLLDADQVDQAALELVDRVRQLVEAVVITDASEAERVAASRQIAAITDRLQQRRRDPVILLARTADGRVENLTQAGSGRLNPQAVPLQFVDLPAPSDPSLDPVPIEVRARCALGAAHGGPPHRAHGGTVAAILDEVLGVAATTAGATGLTVALSVRFSRGTPYGVPLEISGRYTGRDGRKSYASGEVRAGGIITAEATAIFVRPASAG